MASVVAHCRVVATVLHQPLMIISQGKGKDEDEDEYNESVILRLLHYSNRKMIHTFESSQGQG